MEVESEKAAKSEPQPVKEEETSKPAAKPVLEEKAEPEVDGVLLKGGGETKQEVKNK